MNNNPFSSDSNLVYSNYCNPDLDQLRISSGSSSSPKQLTNYVHSLLRKMVLDETYPCVGAHSAIKTGSYRFGLYPELGSDASTSGLARDLFSFIQDRGSLKGPFSSFIASFETPKAMSEDDFEKLLWKQLQKLHLLDSEHHNWSSEVSANPNDSTFSFSFGETALFVVGLHAGSSRHSRTFAWPLLVFNPHDQFENLRKDGKFDVFKNRVRTRDVALQGTINPNLQDFGEESAAKQYSGRAAEPGWKCPFSALKLPSIDTSHNKEEK